MPKTKMNAGMDVNPQYHPDGKKYNAAGEELMDPTPVALPMHFRRPESINDMMKRLIKTHLSKAAAAENSESFEEADDFNVEGEEKEPTTPYEDDLEGLDAPAINEPKERHDAFKKKLQKIDEARKKQAEALEKREAVKAAAKEAAKTAAKPVA